MNRDQILSTALKLVEKSGPEAMSFRALAQVLGVTPMALYGHFADKDELVRGMSDVMYARVLTAFKTRKGKPRESLKHLLGYYYEAVVQLPQLTRLIFATPTDFSTEVKAINDQITDLLSQSPLSPTQRGLWFEILVDFTHGSALATASIPTASPEFRLKQKRRFQKQLDEIFDRIF